MEEAASGKRERGRGAGWKGGREKFGKRGKRGKGSKREGNGEACKRGMQSDNVRS